MPFVLEKSTYGNVKEHWHQRAKIHCFQPAPRSQHLDDSSMFFSVIFTSLTLPLIYDAYYLS